MYKITFQSFQSFGIHIQRSTHEMVPYFYSSNFFKMSHFNTAMYQYCLNVAPYELERFTVPTVYYYNIIVRILYYVFAAIRFVIRSWHGSTVLYKNIGAISKLTLNAFHPF